MAVVKFDKEGKNLIKLTCESSKEFYFLCAILVCAQYFYNHNRKKLKNSGKYNLTLFLKYFSDYVNDLT